MTKRTDRIRLFVSFIFAAFITLGFCGNVFAAKATQTGGTQNSISVTWEEPYISSGSVMHGYDVQIKKAGDKDASYKSAGMLSPQERTYTFTGLDYGTRYNILISYRYTTQDQKEFSNNISLTGAKTMPGKVTGLCQDRWYFFIKEFYAKWDRQDGADGYEWICKGPQGAVAASGTIKNGASAGFNVRKISNEKVYSGQVRAYADVDGTRIYGDWSDEAYFFTQPRVTKAKVKGGKLTVSWKKVAGATGYAVYVSQNPGKGYKRVGKTNPGKHSLTIKKLKGKKYKTGKIYYVYVETLKTVGTAVYTSGRLYYWNTKKNSEYGYF